MLELGRLRRVGRSESTVWNNPTNLTDPTGFVAADENNSSGGQNGSPAPSNEPSTSEPQIVPTNCTVGVPCVVKLTNGQKIVVLVTQGGEQGKSGSKEKTNLKPGELSAADQAKYKRYSEYLRNFGGGDSHALTYSGFLEQEHAFGYLSHEEYTEVAKANGINAATGLLGEFVVGPLLAWGGGKLLPFLAPLKATTSVVEPGSFMTVTEVMSARAAAYQARVTGTKQGMAYVVDGVKFDGFSNGLLIEAKANYSQFVKDGVFRSWWKGADGFVQQAQRQLAAAKGIPIEWRFLEESTAKAAIKLFEDNGIKGIKVVHVP